MQSEKSCVVIVDVSKACVYAPSTRRVYVRIPHVGKKEMRRDVDFLLKSLYGTLDAAVNWSMAYSKVLDKLGFEKGASSPCTFFHRSRKIKMAVHGDEFITEGNEAQLRWLAEELQKEFEVTWGILGAAPHQCCDLASRTQIASAVLVLHL